MREQLITFETAKLAKEKGFNEIIFESDGNCNITGVYKAPTQSLLQKWLRENPKLILWCIPIGTDYEDFVVWDYKIRNHTNGREHTGKLQLKTYEEALEKGLQEALKLI